MDDKKIELFNAFKAGIYWAEVDYDEPSLLSAFESYFESLEETK